MICQKFSMFKYKVAKVVNKSIFYLARETVSKLLKLIFFFVLAYFYFPFFWWIVKSFQCSNIKLRKLLTSVFFISLVKQSQNCWSQIFFFLKLKKIGGDDGRGSLKVMISFIFSDSHLLTGATDVDTIARSRRANGLTLSVFTMSCLNLFLMKRAAKFTCQCPLFKIHSVQL